jgi:hypothetical protein
VLEGVSVVEYNYGMVKPAKNLRPLDAKETHLLVSKFGLGGSGRNIFLEFLL